MRLILKNFHIVDEETDTNGTLIIENGFISGVFPFSPNGVVPETPPLPENPGTAIVIDGSCLPSANLITGEQHSEGHRSNGVLPLLMPAFVDLHAHFRDPGLPGKNAPLQSETLESASLSAASGGFGTVVCMANTKPPIDTIEKAATLKRRSDALGLVDLYPVLSLTKNMEGKGLSEIKNINPNKLNEPDIFNFDGTGKEFIKAETEYMIWLGQEYNPLMLSEDGIDLANGDLFLAAMKEAARLNIPISCHCDLGGDEVSAVRRVIELGKKAGCHIHIAHVSTKETVETIRQAKQDALNNNAAKTGFALTCEAAPHHLCLTEEDAKRLGEKTWGRVALPLRSEDDRQALIHALADGTIDAIATDHAPHSTADKEAGAPGFSGFETAFSALYTELVRGGTAIDLKRLSSLMSANPARLLGFGGLESIKTCILGKVLFSQQKDFQKRGRLLPGHRADLVIIDPGAAWTVDPALFKSRGKNSPFTGRELYGKVLMTLHGGRVVF